MSPYRRCWVIGASAVGSVIAGVLYNTQKMEIHLVGSSVHVQGIQRNGLFLEIVGRGSTRASIPCAQPEEVPPLRSSDLVLMTGKVPSLEKTCARLRSTCNPETVIIVLQNGIGPEEIVSRVLGRSVERGLVL